MVSQLHGLHGQTGHRFSRRARLLAVSRVCSWFLATSLAASWPALWAASCASSEADQLAVAQARDKLRASLNRPVHTRDERDDLSRLLVSAVEDARLERLSLAEVQAALGRGHACQASELCSEKGFTGDDIYYVIGQADDDKIRQLPTLILGFDQHGHVQRVFTLRTH